MISAGVSADASNIIEIIRVDEIGETVERRKTAMFELGWPDWDVRFTLRRGSVFSDYQRTAQVSRWTTKGSEEQVARKTKGPGLDLNPLFSAMTRQSSTDPEATKSLMHRTSSASSPPFAASSRMICKLSLADIARR